MSGGTIRSVKGMRDLYEDELATWRKVESLAAELFTRFGYGEIRTPSVEELQLFVRGVGEGTDIVEKEMYAFQDKDKHETWLCLRPEGTAGVVRALIQAGKLSADAEARVFYLGPMFRRERPAKGRYRQFHQLGVEAFGLPDPSIDVEVMAMLHLFITELGLEGVTLKINSLGSSEDRVKFNGALKSYFEGHKDALSADSQRRLDTNVLRILDSKDEGDQALAKDAPKPLEHLSDDSRRHFDAVQAGLTNLGVPFVVEPSLVRGLDYYTHTVFEALAETGLGAQNAVAGGGRYDALVEQLGGRPTPGIGFAAGIERLVMILEALEKTASARQPDLWLVAQNEAGRAEVSRLAHQLRGVGLCVEIDHRAASVKSQMKRADKSGARFVLVVGDREIEAGEAQLKRMETGDVQGVPLRAEEIATLLA